MGQDSVHEVEGTEVYTGEKGEKVKKLRKRMPPSTLH